MSTSSPREQAATQAQETALQLQGQFTNIAYPALQSLLGRIKGDLSGGFQAEPGNISNLFKSLRTDLNAQYDQALGTSKALIGQRARQSGQIFSTEQISDATKRSSIALEQDRATAERELSFQEASAGLGQFNSLMNLLGAGSQTALGLGSGAMGLQMGAISGLPGMSKTGGALAGAASGASMGTAISPGWGTAIGGVLGGLYGYFGGGG